MPLNAQFQHQFQAWVEDGSLWTSPVLRFRVSQPFNETLKAYREENHLDALPSLQTKINNTYEKMIQSPSFYTPFGEVLQQYSGNAAILAQLPNPSIIILNKYCRGRTGIAADFPDYVPPEPAFGTLQEFQAMISDIKNQNKLVMSYSSPALWNENSPTIQNLTGAPGLNDIVQMNIEGQAERKQIDYELNEMGYFVSPYHPFVQQRLNQLIADLKGTLGFDIIYEDMYNYRDEIFDFNPSVPNPALYREGWLEHTRTHADSFLIIDGGYDRMTESAIGFMGTVLSPEWNGHLGEGNWESYPTAPILYHDKVLPYQHWDEFTKNKETLAWNLAFGCMLNFHLNHWSGNTGFDSPWINVVADFQNRVVSRIAGKKMTEYTDVSANITRSKFEDITVIRNWNNGTSYGFNGHTISSQGALVTSENGNLTAGIFREYNGEELSAGDHFLIVEMQNNAYYIRHPLGNDTPVTINRPSTWTDSSEIQGYVDWTSGYDEIPLTTNEDFIQLNLSQSHNGNNVSHYKITYGETDVSGRNNSGIPTEFRLFQNYPNPFNSQTTIRYDVPATDHVCLKIYNIPGQEIRILKDEVQEAGKYSIRWDGKNDAGIKITTGVYVIKIKVGEKIGIKKILMLK